MLSSSAVTLYVTPCCQSVRLGENSEQRPLVPSSYVLRAAAYYSGASEGTSPGHVILNTR